MEVRVSFFSEVRRYAVDYQGCPCLACQMCVARQCGVLPTFLRILSEAAEDQVPNEERTPSRRFAHGPA